MNFDEFRKPSISCGRPIMHEAELKCIGRRDRRAHVLQLLPVPQQAEVVLVGMGVALLVQVEVALQRQLLQGRRDRTLYLLLRQDL